MNHLLFAFLAAPSCLAAVLQVRDGIPAPVVQDCWAHGDRAYSGAHCVRGGDQDPDSQLSSTAFQVDCINSPTIKYDCADGWVCLDALDQSGKNMAVCAPVTAGATVSNNGDRLGDGISGANTWSGPIAVSPTRQIDVGSPMTALAAVLTTGYNVFGLAIESGIDVWLEDGDKKEISGTRKHCDGCGYLAITDFPSGWANFKYHIDLYTGSFAGPASSRSFLLNPNQLGLPDNSS